jgi:hypothetical protein
MLNKLSCIHLLTITLLFCASCCSIKENQNTVEATSTASSQRLTYPDNLIEYHLKHQIKGKMVFVLTVYKIPYLGHFQFMQLNKDNLFWMSYDFSDFASRGMVHGDVTSSERADVIESLNSIEYDYVTDNQQGDYVLTLSYATSDDYYVYSCQNLSCPIAICSIYELTNAVVDRNQDVYNYSKVTCPIENTSSK